MPRGVPKKRRRRRRRKSVQVSVRDIPAEIFNIPTFVARLEAALREEQRRQNEFINQLLEKI